MAFTIPTAVSLLTADWDGDPRARGAFSGAGEAQPGTRNTKTAGNLPITTNATAFINNQASNATGPLRGVYWEFLATGGYDVSADTKVIACCWQFNAPNRIQHATAANNGTVVRVGTGAATPPANYRTFQIGGNDTPSGSSQLGPLPFLIDLNAASHEASVGTFDNTDVQTWGFGTVRFNLQGTSTTQYFFTRLFVFDTTKGATNIPRFTGAGSTFDDVITAQDGTDFSTKISNIYRRSGSNFDMLSPFEIGDGATATTFNDNGAVVNSPVDDDPNDPRFRLTDQAMRVYLNLRNNAGDTATFSGTYNWGTAAAFDFGQSDAAVVTFNSPAFNGMGDFTVGSSVSGPATFSLNTGSTVRIDGADLDGSTINGNAELQTATDLTGITINGDLDISVAGNNTITFTNVTVTGAITNSGGGTLTINQTGGTLTTTTPGTGNNQVDIVANVDITFTGLPIGCEIRVYDTDPAAGILGTNRAGIETTVTTTFSFTHALTEAGQTVTYQIIADGFVELSNDLMLAATPQTVPITLTPEENV